MKLSDIQRFPIGFWNYCSLDMIGAEAVADWHDCGMTLAMTQEFDPQTDDVQALRSVLDAAQERGLVTIVCDRRTSWRHLTAAGECAYRADFRRALDDFGGHPAVVGFRVGDEPGSDDFEDACSAYRIQHEMAPHLTPFLNLYPGCDDTLRRVGEASWPRYLEALTARAGAELLCYDCYSQMKEGTTGWETYFRNLRDYREVAHRFRIPFWVTLLSVPHYDYRLPDEDALRWQLHTAVAHGAQGILWFFMYMRQPHSNYRLAPVDEHFERTETFARLSRVNRTFLNWHAPLIRRLRLRQTAHFARSWADCPGIEVLRRVQSVRSDEPLVVSEFDDEQGHEYVAVVNNSPWSDTRVRLVCRGDRPALLRNDWHARMGAANAVEEAREHVATGFYLAPGQMEIFRVDDRCDG